MTNCTIFKSEINPDEVKAIEFFHYLDPATQTLKDATTTNPAHWRNIVLMTKGQEGEMDVMFAYQEKAASRGAIYLGWWNDGVAK